MGRVLHENEALGDLIVARARAWLGTPYEHRQSCRGAGTDCLGLLRGLWRELCGDEPEALPPYSGNWLETDGTDRMLAAFARHFVPVPSAEIRTGDVLAFRTASAGPVKHVGVMASAPVAHGALIHAYLHYGVVETPLTPAWQRRLVAAFRFPEVSV